MDEFKESSQDLNSRAEDIESFFKEQLNIGNKAKQELNELLENQSKERGIDYSQLPDSEKKKIYLSPKHYYNALHGSDKVSDNLFQLYLYSYRWIIWNLVKKYCWDSGEQAELRQQAYMALWETFAEFESCWITGDYDTETDLKFLERLQKNIKKEIRKYKEQFSPGFIADERQFRILKTINQIEETDSLHNTDTITDEGSYTTYVEADIKTLTETVNRKLNTNHTADTIKKVLQKRSCRFNELPIDISAEDYRIAGANATDVSLCSSAEEQYIWEEEQADYSRKLEQVLSVLKDTDKKILRLSSEGYDSKEIGSMLEPPMSAAAVRKRIERMAENVKKKLKISEKS